jgi:uncharacterized protein YlxP (DUF503 family)
MVPFVRWFSFLSDKKCYKKCTGERQFNSPPLVYTVSDPALFVSLLTIELLIPWAQSLKDRRSAVRGLKDRLRSRFNASVTIVYQDRWQQATIAVCIVDSDKQRLESAMTRVRQLTEEHRTCKLPACTRNGCSQNDEVGGSNPPQPQSFQRL